jgi:ribosomal protein L19E
MKKLFLSLAMATFIAGTVSVSFGQDLDKQSDKSTDKMNVVKEPVLQEPVLVVVKVDSLTDYKNLTKVSEIRFTENDKRIGELRLNNTIKDKAKHSAKSAEIDLLEQRNTDLRKDLTFYKEDSKIDWSTFKTQFNTDMDKLTMDLKNLKIIASN